MELIETVCQRRPAYVRWQADVEQESICLVVAATVAASYRLPLTIFHARSRCAAPVAFARQIAMYVTHVWLGLSLTEVGRYFGRDRTTVSHACRIVEERRENPNIDRMVSSIEAAVDLWLENGRSFGGDA